MTEQPVRVLHIGDVHLGVELYGRPVPEKGYGTRVEDFLRALEAALAHAAESDLVLLPGDIYKNCEPSPTVQREFAARIRRAAREAPVAIIPGNHDLPNAWGRASSIDIFRVLEVENVHVLRKPEVVPIETRRGTVLLAPMPFFPRSALLALEEARGKTIPEVVELMGQRVCDFIERMRLQVVQERSVRGEATPAVLMAHYTVQGAVFGGYGRGAMLAPEIQIPLGVVKDSTWDYVALAHIHKHQSIPPNDTGQPPVLYPGSLERVDFGEEQEEKGVVLAEVARGHSTWRFVPMPSRPFVTLKVSGDEADPLGSVVAKLEAARERVDGAVVRVLYTLPAGHPNLPDRDLRRALEGAHYVAGIRREVPPQTSEARLKTLTTQMDPMQALEMYLSTRPELEPQREDLVERARLLVDEVTKDVG